MLFNIRQNDNIHIITLTGVTFSSSQISNIQQQVSDLTRFGHVNFVADMSQLKLLNSTVSSMLMVCLKKVRSEGGDLILANAGESIRSQLNAAQLASVFTIAASVEEAKEKFKQKIQ